MVNNFVEIKRNSINEANNEEEKEGFWNSKDIKYSLSDALKFMCLCFNFKKQKTNVFDQNSSSRSELFWKDKVQLLRDLDIASIINSIKELKTMTRYVYKLSMMKEDKYSK